MKLALSAWSFHEPIYAGKLRQTNVPAEAALLGFRRVELLEMFLWRKPPGFVQRILRRARPSPTPALPRKAGEGEYPDYSRDTLNGLRGARLRAGVQLVCWDVDTDLTLAEADARRAQLTHIGTAIEAARFLGAPLLRLTTGGQDGDASGVGRAVDALRAILPVALAGGVRLALENHFGLSADPQALVEIVTAIHSPQVGVCLDLGNFREGEAEAGIGLLAPHAIHVHAKSHSFDANGEETRINYGAALHALHAAGYDGMVSIEFEGDGDPAEGIRKTKALIEKYQNLVKV